MKMVLDPKTSTFGSQIRLQFNIWFIFTLYYKMLEILLKNAIAKLLQNTTYLLQNASGLLLQ